MGEATSTEMCSRAGKTYDPFGNSADFASRISSVGSPVRIGTGSTDLWEEMTERSHKKEFLEADLSIGQYAQ